MVSCDIPANLVSAVVTEVLPKFGLAYLEDGQGRTWAVTRCTKGAGLDLMASGQAFELTLEQHTAYSVVGSYRPLP
jgi:hypothetical protein